MIQRPAPTDVSPRALVYVERVEDGDILRTLRDQKDEFARLLSPLDEAAAGHRYAPGKWSVKEVVGHVADAERIFTYRLLRIARGDTTPLPGFNENDYVPAGQFDDRSLASLLAEFEAVRASSIALVEGLPPDVWSRATEANGHRTTAAAVAYLMVGHAAHHLIGLRERYGIGDGGAAA